MFNSLSIDLNQNNLKTFCTIKDLSICIRICFIMSFYRRTSIKTPTDCIVGLIYRALYIYFRWGSPFDLNCQSTLHATFAYGFSAFFFLSLFCENSGFSEFISTLHLCYIMMCIYYYYYA